MRPRVLVLCIVALVVASILGLVLASRERPDSGLVAGRLRPCPDAPNCVSSQAVDEAQAVEPLRFPGDPHEAFARALAIVNGWSGTTELARTEDYAHLEVVTSLLRFRDDVELQLDVAAKVIHVRSASRVGHSDLGANRERVERLRAAFSAR